MTSLWLSHDFPITFSWFFHYFLWLSHELFMTISWFSYDFLMTFSWLGCDFFITFSWLSHDFLIFLMIFSGFHMLLSGFSLDWLTDWLTNWWTNLLTNLLNEVLNCLNWPWFVLYRTLFGSGTSLLWIMGESARKGLCVAVGVSDICDRCDMWHVIHDMWLVTHDKWYIFLQKGARKFPKIAKNATQILESAEKCQKDRMS